MPRAPALDLAHARAFDGDRHLIGSRRAASHRASDIRAGSSGLTFSMKTSCTSGPVLVKPQASVSPRPSTSQRHAGQASAERPLAALPPGCSSARCARYQIAGAPSRRCGSLASSGLPETGARARYHPVVGGAAADKIVDRAWMHAARFRGRLDVAADRAGRSPASAAERRRPRSGIRSSISAELRPCAARPAAASRSSGWCESCSAISLIDDDAVGRPPRLRPMPQATGTPAAVAARASRRCAR